MLHLYKASCTRDNLKLIRQFVQAVLHDFKFQFSEIEINQLILAVDEVCSNLIIYSHQCNPAESIEVRIHDLNEKVLFEIIDRSTDQFNIKDYQEPDLQNIISERRKGGLGLMLVNRIMDSVEVIYSNKENTWQLSKNKSKKSNK
ncbi:MAG: ATP-binding protein [Cytophagales bacterium]|nr:MAG: ATP-binding protein [Cytophagales bacterium]